MYPIRDYFQNARENETVFRNILRDLKSNGDNRKSGCSIPEDLETEAPLEDIFEKYSGGKMFPEEFTITNFILKISSPVRVALIEFESVSFLSGGGAGLIYILNGNEVEYLDKDYLFYC